MFKISKFFASILLFSSFFSVSGLSVLAQNNANVTYTFGKFYYETNHWTGDWSDWENSTDCGYTSAKSVNQACSMRGQNRPNFHGAVAFASKLSKVQTAQKCSQGQAVPGYELAVWWAQGQSNWQDKNGGQPRWLVLSDVCEYLKLPRIGSGFFDGQTYQNPYFPDFGINYPKDWQFATSTKPSENYKNLVKRTVILRKNQTVLTMTFMPLIITGCSGNSEAKLLADLGQYKRFEGWKTGEYTYSKHSNCNLENRIKTNILTKDLQATNPGIYQEFLKQFETMPFILSTKLESNNPAEIEQADWIVKSSALE